MAKEYWVRDDWDGLIDCADSVEEVEILFESIKESKMDRGVQIGESFVSIVETEDDFETETIIKKVVAVQDEELTKEIGTPEQNGYEWLFWAKWQEA